MVCGLLVWCVKEDFFVLVFGVGNIVVRILFVELLEIGWLSCWEIVSFVGLVFYIW